jgi:citrate lyase alpha subunit
MSIESAVAWQGDHQSLADLEKATKELLASLPPGSKVYIVASDSGVIIKYWRPDFIEELKKL